MLDHAKLPAPASAPLPTNYEQARHELALCNRVDECVDWADKALALASYARQANDDTLLKLANKIRARAVDRAGALLKEIEAEKGGRPKTGGDAPTSSGRMQAARDAGLSKDQAIQAIRVNNVPREDFERLVEGENPPTVTALAEMGTKKNQPRPDIAGGSRKAHDGATSSNFPQPGCSGREPADFYAATHGFGALRRMREACEKFQAETAVRGLHDDEIMEVRNDLDAVWNWLEKVDELTHARLCQKPQAADI